MSWLAALLWIAKDAARWIAGGLLWAAFVALLLAPFACAFAVGRCSA